MIANSTHISNRMFRTQRFVILAILSGFVLLLFIVGVSAHKQLKANPDLYNKASDKLASYYGSAVNKFFSDELELEREAEAQEQADAKEKAAKQKAKEIDQDQTQVGDSSKANHQRVDKRDIHIEALI